MTESRPLSMARTQRARPVQLSVSARLRRYLAQQEVQTAYGYLALPILILLLIKVYPVVYNVYLGFTRYEMVEAPQWIGLRNYVWVLTEHVNQKALVNTVLYAMGAVPTGTALALLVAVLLNRPMRGRVAYRLMYYLPVVTSAVVVSLVWRLIFNVQSGLLNTVLGYIGIPPQKWLSSETQALPSLIVVMVWSAIGYNMVTYLAGLQDIPPELYEAARIDGASDWHYFWSVTLPLLNPVTLFIVVNFAVSVFRSFSYVFLLTQGGPNYATTNLVWEVYTNAFSFLRFGRAAALSITLLVIILGISMVQFRMIKVED